MKKMLIYSGILILMIGILGGMFFVFKPEQELADELTLYNWEDYLAEGVLEDFEAEFGVKVNEVYFEDESVVLAELEKNPNKYDLVVAGDPIIKEMVALDLLAPLDKRNIPNLKNVDEKCVMEGFEKYLAPYLWGTTGLAINTKYVPEDTDSWGVLWDEKYAGKIGLLNNPEEVVAMASRYIGLPVIPQSVSDFKKVEKFLLIQKPLVKGYFEYLDMRDDLISEELWAAQMYDGAAKMATLENPNIKYIIPREGGSEWIENFVILKSSKKKYTAEVFINYILDTEVSAKIAEYQISYSCNAKAMDLLGDEFMEEVSPQSLKFLEYFSDYETSEEVAELEKELWEKLISGKN